MGNWRGGDVRVRVISECGETPTFPLVRHEEFSLRVVISVPTFLKRLCEKTGNPEPICRFLEAGNPVAAAVDSAEFPQ